MPDLGDGGPMDEIVNHLVSVGRHGDEIAMFCAGGLQNRAGRLAPFVARGHPETFFPQLLRHALQILAVLLHLL